MNGKRILFLALLLLAGSLMGVQGIDLKDTRMMSDPAISQNHIAFVYAGNLWIANRDGSYPRQLTTDDGQESLPVFSPDGKMLAFSAQYDGNTDVFIVPVTGGVPRRLSWHPSGDYVRGFTPDGKSVVFISGRFSHTGRYTQIFTVSTDGGYPTELPIPNAYWTSYSPDGKKLAYTPLSEPFGQWKHYRGGRNSIIRLIDLKSWEWEFIPQPEGRCNDTDPMWIGDKVYFRSDRNGEFNLFSFDPASKEMTQLTNYTNFPVLRAKQGNGQIIYERQGYLYTYDPANGKDGKITVGIAADLQELRPRWVEGSRYIRAAHLSPKGERAVFNFRGEIISLPVEHGDPRNLTQSTGAHDKEPAWSPDGKKIAWFTDRSGEYQLAVGPQDGKGEVKYYDIDGNGFYAFPKWSPDSKKIAFVDNGRVLYWIELASGTVHKIDSDEAYTPGVHREMMGDWSYDSRWIVYTKHLITNLQQAFLYNLDEQKSYPLSDGMSEVGSPCFDQSGKYVYFLSSTDAGPVKNWFAQSANDMEMTSTIFLASLQKDNPNPFAKKSDEVKVEEHKKEKKEKPEKLHIDMDGLSQRIVDVPQSTGSIYSLAAGKGNLLFYLKQNAAGRSSLYRYNIAEQKEEELMAVSNFVLSDDRSKMLVSSGSTFAIVSTSGKPKMADGRLNTSDISVKIDPTAEWKQIFEEAWRVNRDYFYDPGMHGADWETMKKKYEIFLPHVACRDDLNRVIMWMCSELVVGHHRVGGGDQLESPERVGGGLLGADYEIDHGRYRFTKVFGGLNWNPRLRAPLTEPGIQVRAGEYLLAVNGKELTADLNLFSLFEQTANRITEITVGPKPGMEGSRTLKVVPVSNESSLRNRDWVEGNLQKVNEATGGKVAYVYVPNTAGGGHTYFKRYFFPQVNKQAIIVDERYNSGGQIADYYIDHLMRPYHSMWNYRYGADLMAPNGSIQGPKVMLIDETAGSGGDLLPFMFRKFELGKLVGKRTWGGLVGVLGFPELMDGGSVTAPNVAIWTKDGWVVENEGVPPDVEVEQDPKEVMQGKDPQLEKAIEIILKELEENPFKKPERPPYPKRAGKMMSTER